VKKVISLLITFIFVFVLFPATALAATDISSEGQLIDSLNNGSGDYILQSNITIVTSTASVPSGHTVNLDLNGYEITLQNPVSVSGALNIYGAGKVIRGGSMATNAYAITIDNGGQLTLSDATFDGGASTTSARSFVLVSAGGSFIMNSGNIVNNYVNAISNGGGVSVSGTFTMNGGTISGNRACSGGGIHVNSGGVFNLHNDGSVENNQTLRSGTSGGHGGGVYVNGTFNMDGGSVARNTAAYDGGGVAINSGTLNFSNGTITENAVPLTGTDDPATRRYGGGIWTSSSSNSVLNMTGGTVSKNRAYYGAGININCASPVSTISGGIITQNEAVSFGGGIQVDNGGVLSISGDAEISSNVAAAGGGLSVYGVFLGPISKATVASDAKIINNTANGGEGGGIYIPMLAEVIVDGATITGNHALASGGGVFVGAAMSVITSTFTLTSGVLCGNTSDRSGADLATAVAAITTIMPATSMGLPTTDVDGWYWDLQADRFASSTNPQLYTPNQSGMLIDIIAESLTTPTPTPTAGQPTPTVVPSGDVPKTGDNNQIGIMLVIMLLGISSLAFSACVMKMHRKGNT
jgi:hypothetical protein